jgi:hypothetical protein
VRLQAPKSFAADACLRAHAGRLQTLLDPVNNAFSIHAFIESFPSADWLQASVILELARGLMRVLLIDSIKPRSRCGIVAQDLTP